MRGLRWVALLATMWMAGAASAQPVAPEVAALYNLAENGGFEDGDILLAWWGRSPLQDRDGNNHLREGVFHLLRILTRRPRSVGVVGL